MTLDLPRTGGFAWTATDASAIMPLYVELRSIRTEIYHSSCERSKVLAALAELVQNQSESVHIEGKLVSRRAI